MLGFLHIKRPVIHRYTVHMKQPDGSVKTWSYMASSWEPWYAWVPVTVRVDSDGNQVQQTAWLQPVERRLVEDHDAKQPGSFKWIYRWKEEEDQ